MILGMERHDTLQQLRHGNFPIHFCERIGDAFGDVRSLIRNMTSQEQYDVVDVKKRVMSFMT